MQELEQRGVQIGGSPQCNQQCNIFASETEDTWRYQSTKNKSKLKTRNKKRSIRKQEKRESEQER